MHPAVQTRVEGKRGCGYRKPGGLYLINKNEGRPCGRIPFPLIVCPCCGEGFRPSRGYRWVDGQKLLESAPECSFDGIRTESKCLEDCSFREGNEENVGRAILIWVSPDNYTTTEEFLHEAGEMGISRRLSGDQVPRGLIVGETWVFLAHREAIIPKPPESGSDSMWKPDPIPGVFHAFVPAMIEYVIKGTETDGEIANLVKRGITPVQVFND